MVPAYFFKLLTCIGFAIIGFHFIKETIEDDELEEFRKAEKEVNKIDSKIKSKEKKIKAMDTFIKAFICTIGGEIGDGS